jgi:hypothetical protein
MPTLVFPLRVKQFVAGKDADNATLYTCRGADHPALYSETFFTGSPHWIDSPPPELTDRQRGRTLVTGGRCYYHNFLRVLLNFRRKKIGFFSRKPML